MSGTQYTDNYWTKIQKLIDKKGITASKLAHLAGFPDNGSIYALKSGRIKRPSFWMIMRIADALEVSLDELRPDKQGEKK
ncbi:helix-turn-helix domain-containing protein [Lacticaseibacillus paracasei]|uniref:helix-turn-helix domain-containing protein n=1 Tax=Lacticaseibacillus paracasei TaxID=1597 RepID=UPI00384E0FFF